MIVFGASSFQDNLERSTWPSQHTISALEQRLWAAVPYWRAEVHHQIAEGDLVHTHKTHHGTHLGSFLGIAPTRRVTRFSVMDIMQRADHRPLDRRRRRRAPGATSR
ncbi:ester cyclase [Pseudorhodoplanes sinuspersici]|nr:ester cyclase [Pseudorhodoplanes sinuspersici]